MKKKVRVNEKSIIFQDSGAFSAMVFKDHIDLGEYMQYIIENEDKIKIYCNLDIIGDHEATWRNQAIMEEAGLRPLPVFHARTDPPELLERCLEYDYFALGGIAHAPSYKLRIQTLDRWWEQIVDDNGFPRSKVHGFGMADIRLMSRYPWFSIDSSSWTAYGRFGIVIFPKTKNGKPQYNQPPIKLHTSKRSEKANDAKALHYERLTKVEQNVFLDYIGERDVPLGKSKLRKVKSGYMLRKNEVFINKEKTRVEKKLEEGIINNNWYRDFINYCYYQEVCDSQKPYPWSWKRKRKTEMLF